MNDTALIPLDAAEVAQLSRFEERIQQGLASFIEVGEALGAIRERRLYRATHGTFEDYCVARWGMKRNYANKLVAAAEAVRSLPPQMVTIVTNESQAREIASVPAPERAAVVEKAIQATGGKITAAAIREAAVAVDAVTAPAAESVEVVVEQAPSRRVATTFSFHDWCAQTRTLVGFRISAVPSKQRAEAVQFLAQLISEIGEQSQ